MKELGGSAFKNTLGPLKDEPPVKHTRNTEVFGAVILALTEVLADDYF